MTKYEQGVESTKMLIEDYSIYKKKTITIVIVCTIILMLVIGIILNGIVISTKNYLRQENLLEQKTYNEFQQIEDAFDEFILNFEKYTGIVMFIGKQKMNQLLDRISRFYVSTDGKYKCYQDSFIKIKNDKGFNMTRVGYGKKVFVKGIGRNKIKCKYNRRIGYYMKVKNLYWNFKVGN